MMSSLSQSSWLCSLHTTKTIQPSILIIPFHPQIKSLKFSSFTVSNSNDQSSLTPISSNESEQTLEESKPNRVKLALEKAREYKKSLQLDDNQEISNDPVAESAGIVSGSGGLVSGDESGDVKEVPEAVRIAMEKAREYQNNKENVGDVKSKVENVNSPGEDDGAEKAIPEVVRRAMEKAKEYKENKGVMSNVENENPPGDMKGGDMEVPEAVRIAMGKANEYKKNKGVIDNSSSIVEDSKLIGSEGGNASNMGSRNIEQNTEKKGDLKISSIDFVGLNFSDKKTGRALPAGLVPVSNPFPDDDLPEVEILVGDASKFGEVTSSESKTPSQEEGSDLYKPKISTWGMFPRPNNISKTFGGGRNIRPGEALETPEDKAAKQARTRQLIAAYKRKMGLNIDPKLKAECEKALKNGDSLMDVGKLKEALPFYQTVMDKLAFQTELYGLAALQWSICEDSLSRSENARAMYEKLQSHPNAEVSKKARQFMFSFQAMEMMKVTRSTGKPKNTGYQSYFEAFVEDKPNYTSESTEEKEDAFDQALLYIVFLASPILLVLLYVAIKQV